MTVQLVRAPRLYGGVPYAYAAIAEPGALAFTAGACPLDQNEMVVGAGDVARQTQQVMANLTEALAAAGATVTGVTCSPPGTSSVPRSASTTRRARCSGSPHSATATSSSRSKQWPSLAALALRGDLPGEPFHTISRPAP